MQVCDTVGLLDDWAGVLLRSECMQPKISVIEGPHLSSSVHHFVSSCYSMRHGSAATPVVITDCGEAEAGERPAMRRAAAGEQAKAIQAAEASKKRE